MNAWILNALSSVVGAAVGFGSALISQYLFAKHNRRKKLRGVHYLIRGEINEITKVLKVYINNDVKLQRLESKLPVMSWETAIYSGVLLQLIESGDEGEDMYKSMIRTYARVGWLNDSEYLSKLEKKEQVDIMQEIIDEYEKIKSYAVKIFGLPRSRGENK